MKFLYYVSSALVGCLFSAVVNAETVTIGWIEHVAIQPHGLVMKAKIDTGADNSSVHAEDIVVTERDGIKLVKFTMQNKQGESVQMEEPLIRYALIKRKGAEPLRRPVVEMALCIGDTARKVHVNLANRGNFTYRMLIGRSYLRHGYLVDSNRKYIAEPACAEKAPAGQSPGTT